MRPLCVRQVPIVVCRPSIGAQSERKSVTAPTQKRRVARVQVSSLGSQYAASAATRGGMRAKQQLTCSGVTASAAATASTDDTTADYKRLQA